MGSKIRLGVELTAAAVLLAVTLWFAAGFFAGFARLSLSHDELWSIVNFAARGPGNALTTYTAPNNHILFNAINSLFPGIESLDPLRARFLSFIAVAGAVALAVGYFAARERNFVLASISAFVIVGPQEFIAMNLQARGYGLVQLLTVAAVLATLEYYRKPGKRALAVLGAATLLGTWTMPFFLAYAGLLMALLFAVTRRRETFIAGAATLIAVIAVHAPVLLEMAAEQQNYAFDQFGEVQAVFKLLNRYLFEGLPNGVQFFAVCLFAAGPWLLRSSFREVFGSADFVIGFSALLFLVVALLMKDPIERSCAFVMFPVALVLFRSIGRLVAAGSEKWGPTAAGVCIAALCVWAALTRPAWLNHTPSEDWQGASELIRRIHPGGVSIATVPEGVPGWLPHYLGKKYTVPESFDGRAFGDGDQIVVDFDSHAPPDGRVSFADRPEAPVTVDLPQVRNQFLRISFVPPASGEGLTSLSVVHKPLTVSRKLFRIVAGFDPSQPGTLFLYSPSNSTNPLHRLEVRAAYPGDESHWRPIPDSKISRFGRLWVVDPGESRAEKLRIDLWIDEPADEIPGLRVWRAIGDPSG